MNMELNGHTTVTMPLALSFLKLKLKSEAVIYRTCVHGVVQGASEHDRRLQNEYSTQLYVLFLHP